MKDAAVTQPEELDFCSYNIAAGKLRELQRFFQQNR